MRQIRMMFAVSEEAIRRRFERAVGKPVSLTITDNATSLISVKSSEGILEVRLHRIFLPADGAVLDEIGRFLRHRKGRTPLIREYIKDHQDEMPARKPRRQRLKTQGQYYDLEALFHKLNRAYFGGRVLASITWGAKRKRGMRRTLGSYSNQTNTIRINPDLDRKTVPLCVIEHVVHHEMLHADLGTASVNGRRCVHSKEFREKEKLFGDYEKAVAWCR